MRITKETQVLLGGDRDVLAYDKFVGETQPIPLTFTSSSGSALDITNYTFNFTLTRKIASYISETKNGISITPPVITDPNNSTAIDLSESITVTNPTAGQVLFYIPASVTSIAPTDQNTPLLYIGEMQFNDNASVGPLIQIIPVILIVRMRGE